jgi:hypothetical protein
VTIDQWIWLAAAIAWGYLAGELLAALAERGPLRVPIVTPLLNRMASALNWWMHLNQQAVNGLSEAVDRGGRALHLR